MINLSVNVNKVATLRNSRGGRVPSVTRGGRDVPRGRRAGHHRASARGRAPHPAGDVREIAGAAGAAAVRHGTVEFNIEGDPRPDLHRPRASSATRSVHARAGDARRDHESGGLAAGHAAATRSTAIIARLQGAPASASACSSIPRRRRSAGPRRLGADRIELYTEPFARAFERGAGAGRAIVRALRGGRATLAHALGLGVNAGPRSRSRTTCRCSGRCRTSTKCRSATRSSATRCGSASTAPSATTSRLVWRYDCDRS